MRFAIYTLHVFIPLAWKPKASCILDYPNVRVISVCSRYIQLLHTILVAKNGLP